jgi:hypothetical protein
MWIGEDASAGFQKINLKGGEHEEIFRRGFRFGLITDMDSCFTRSANGKD